MGSHRWLFQSNESAPRAARRALAGVLQDAGASDGATEDALVVISELVTNSVVHSTLDGDELVNVSVTIDADKLRVQISDAPGPFAAADPNNDEGGFGLQLVELMSDRWGIERSGRNCVWFEIDR